MILIVNPGSSSVKIKLYEVKQRIPKIVLSDSIDGINCPEQISKKRFLKLIIKLEEYIDSIRYVGYRIVSDGNLKDGTEVNKSSLNKIERASDISPLHTPYSLKSIKLFKQIFPDSFHVLYFDNTFFANIPLIEKTFPINKQIAEKYNIYKIGYHGISHQFALDKVKPSKKEKVITIHLGAGCSITAIKNGQPVATSMSFTPMDGLIMQSRCGSIDPGAVLYLSEKLGIKNTRILLNNKSGLAGLTDTDGAMLDILYLSGKKIEDENYLPPKNIHKNINNYKSSLLAFDMYCMSIKKYIGSYSAIMGGIDRIIFTGKIGAGSSIIRKSIMTNLEYLKVKKIDVVETNEELAIANKIIKKFL